MKKLLALGFCYVTATTAFAQHEFIGVAKYSLTVAGSESANTDSMKVVFDSSRILTILYLPDSNRVIEKWFLDDLKESKSYKIDPQSKSFQVDSLKSNAGYNFVNSNSLGSVNRELCIRYLADLQPQDRSFISSAECLAAINFRSHIANYSFLGVQPMIVDNRIVFDYTVTNVSGTKPTIVLSEIKPLSDVSSYFDLSGYAETR